MDRLDWTAKWADYTPNKIAITSYDANKSYSYSDLHIYANRLIQKFTELQLEEGDRIAVLAEHGLEYMVLFVACQRMGLVIVPLNYRQSVNEISKLVTDCTPRLFIHNAKHFSKAQHLPLKNIKVISFDALETFYISSGTISNKYYTIKEDNALFIFYTSGTTGSPKGVIYTNKMLFWNSLNTSMQLGITFRDSTINTLPYFRMECFCNSLIA